jgi:FkbM family methyltransferase
MEPAILRPREHRGPKRMWRSLAYNVHTYLLRRRELTADLPWLSARLRAGAEDMLARRLFKTGHYEPGVTDFLLRYLSTAPQDVIFDVGANVGYYSVLAHRVCGDSVPVYAIEAEADNHRQLLHNLALNAATSVVPSFCAVSDEPGELELYLWKASNRGKHSLVPFEGAETVKVEAKTLAQLYREHGLEGRTISLLKIDIEGAEHQAFLGAGPVLDRCAVIASEVSPKFLKRAGVDLDEHLDVVCSRGFALFEIHDDRRVTRCTADQLRGSPKGRNVAYVREDLLDASWAKDLLGA